MNIRQARETDARRRLYAHPRLVAAELGAGGHVSACVEPSRGSLGKYYGSRELVAIKQSLACLTPNRTSDTAAVYGDSPVRVVVSVDRKCRWRTHVGAASINYCGFRRLAARQRCLLRLYFFIHASLNCPIVELNYIDTRICSGLVSLRL